MQGAAFDGLVLNLGLEIDIPVDGNPVSAQAKENHFATTHLC